MAKGGGGGIVGTISSVATAVVAPVLAPVEIAKAAAPDATAKAVSAVSNVPILGNAAKAANAGADIIGDYASGNSSQGQKDLQTVAANALPLVVAAAAPAVASFVSDNTGLNLTPEDLQFPSPTGSKPNPGPGKSGGGGGGGAVSFKGQEAPSAAPLLAVGGLALLLLKKR